ncbi:MAG: Bifunctional ligase/repressor BirA [Gammaproteobacteria bacterium]|nr:Bifunctional ligase/repressor BirA [Gammaproteobacteria bacterium]
MNSRINLLRLMSDGKFHSGEELGRMLSISRTAVWKMIRSFQRYGLDVYSIKGKGHRLSRPIEFLEKDHLLSCIDPEASGLIHSITIHTEIDSTNQYLLEKSDSPEFHGHITLAEFQSSGRGRRGNTWISPFGTGICLSVGWHYDPAPDPLTVISLAAGVAVIRALKEFNINDAGLKWPNDVFWRGRKLGGTLLEIRCESAGPCNIVLGVGINFSFPKSEMEMIDQPWIDIAGIKQPLPSRNAFTATLISEIVRILAGFNEKTTPGILEEWRQYDCVKGQQVTLLLPEQSVTGMSLGIDDNGSLLMSINGKVRRFGSGEISLRVQH